jgi:ABC-type branched-subunit amino acid transport system substrate-binding protein
MVRTLVLIVLLALTGGGALCTEALCAPSGAAAEQSLALLQQADLQGLPPAERQQLLLEVAARQFAAGQVEPALPLLTQVVSAAEPLAPPCAAQLRRLLPQLTALQLTALAASAAGTPNGPFLQTLLTERLTTAQPPVIAVLLPLTGRYAPYGELVRRGIELALATDPLAKAVNVRFFDSAGDGATAERLIEELAADPAVWTVIGPLTSGEASPATVRAIDRKLPLLLLAPREGTTGSAQGVFRLALTAEVQVRAVAGHAVQVLGLQRFAVLAPATRQGENFADLFQAEITRLGGTLAARHSFAPEAVDLRDDLQRLAGAIRAAGGAEALFLPDAPRQVGLIAPQLGFARLDQLRLLGTASWHSPELVRLAGPRLEGAVFADGFYADSLWPEVRDFVTRFQAAYDMPPGIFGAQGYDAARIVLTLLARPGVRDRETLRRALATLRDFPGVTGRTGFAPDGEPEKTLFLLQVQDGVVVQIN